MSIFRVDLDAHPLKLFFQIVFYLHFVCYGLFTAYLLVSLLFYSGQAQDIGIVVASGAATVLGFPWHQLVSGLIADPDSLAEALLAFCATTVNLILHYAAASFAFRRG